MAATWEMLTVDGGGMRTYMNIPDGGSTYAGVVVAQHAGGVDAFIQEMVDRLAEGGFAAIAPDLYHREPNAESEDVFAMMGRLRDDQIIRDMTAAKELLRSQENVSADRIGVTGFCMGGRVAYLMAGSDGDYKAAVDFYGGTIASPWGNGPSPISLTSQIACPVLGLFGDDDENPSPDDVKMMEAELTKHGKTYEFHSYPNTGHAFMTEGRPGHNADSVADAWPRTLDWFRKYLV